MKIQILDEHPIKVDQAVDELFDGLLFELTGEPVTGTLLVYRNGMRMQNGGDFSVEGKYLNVNKLGKDDTFLGDTLSVDYQTKISLMEYFKRTELNKWITKHISAISKKISNRTKHLAFSKKVLHTQ